MQQNANTKSQLADDKIAFYQSKADAAEKAHADMRMSNLSNGLLGVTDPKAYAAMYPNLIKSGYDPKELADPQKPEEFAGWKAALNAAHPPFAAQKVADTESATAKKLEQSQEKINLKKGSTTTTLDAKTESKLSDYVTKDAPIYKRGTQEGKARAGFDAATEAEELLKGQANGYALQAIQSKLNIEGNYGALNQGIAQTLSKLGNPQSLLNDNQKQALLNVVQSEKKNSGRILSNFFSTAEKSKADQFSKSPNNAQAWADLKNQYSVGGSIGGVAATAHPQADAALKWAQANPNDPRAAKILKSLGK